MMLTSMIDLLYAAILVASRGVKAIAVAIRQTRLMVEKTISERSCMISSIDQVCSKTGGQN